MSITKSVVASAIFSMAASAAVAADFREDTIYASRGPVVVVPSCEQNLPPIGLACIPRAAFVAPDPLALRDTVDLDRLSRRRPYRQLFTWDP